MPNENSEARKCANTNRASIEKTYEGVIDMANLAINQSACTINVPFYGSELYVVNHNGEPYAPMKPIVEGMGLAWQSQLAKIKQRFSSTVTEIVMVAADGKSRTMICLALRKLAA
jgi:hypothetical protein